VLDRISSRPPARESVRYALVAVLFAVACGEAAPGPAAPGPASPGPASPVTLSGVGTKTATAQLEPGDYSISWTEPDSEWEAYCEKDKKSLPISIWVSPTLGSDSDHRTGTIKQNTQGGGTYICQITAKAGSAWAITFTPF
jgi:hypothetical protein